MSEFTILVENSAPSQGKPAKSARWASEILQNLGIYNVADLGCGRLRNLIIFENHFSEITLIDTDLQCDRIRGLTPEVENIKLITSSIFQEEQKLYEAIFLISVLHIIPEPKMRSDLLDLAISKLTRPGFLIVDVPTGISYYRHKCTNDRKYSDGYVMGHGRHRTFYKNFHAKDLDALLSMNDHLKLYKKVYFNKHLVRIMTNRIEEKRREEKRREEKRRDHYKNNRTWTMPRKNRVDPFGQIIAVSARGTLMGNRGVIHSSDGSIKKLWRSKSWITCLLEFKDQKRDIMSSGKYTELFFLDEATSFSAGHRPCSTCRHQNFKRFKSLWLSANSHKLGLNATNIDNIDNILHTERILPDNTKNIYKEKLCKLPNGTMLSLSDEDSLAYLLVNGLLLEWSPFGYTNCLRISPDHLVNVLTPKSVVSTFLGGYSPNIHYSASSFIDLEFLES